MNRTTALLLFVFLSMENFRIKLSHTFREARGHSTGGQPVCYFSFLPDDTVICAYSTGKPSYPSATALGPTTSAQKPPMACNQYYSGLYFSSSSSSSSSCCSSGGSSSRQKRKEYRSLVGVIRNSNKWSSDIIVNYFLVSAIVLRHALHFFLKVLRP